MSIALESLLKRQSQRDHDWSSVLPTAPVAAFLNSLQREALQAFESQGIPTRRLESWKGTNFAVVEAMNFAGDSPSDEATGHSPAPGSDPADLLFVDGRLQPAAATRADLPSGVRLLSLFEAASEIPEILEQRLAALPDLKKEPLVALNTLLFDDLAVLYLERGARVEKPIRIHSIATNGSAAGQAQIDCPRLLVVAEREAAATLVFATGAIDASDDHGDQASTADREQARGLTVFVAEYHLADGARIETVQLQEEPSARVHVTSAHAHLEANAHFDSHVFSLGDGLVRSELSIALSGPGAETRMRGFFLGRGTGHIDHFTTVDHRAEHCNSDQEYRGVLGESSKGVFRGRVLVQPGAQKTDAKQSNPNLLLSDRATIDTKPQLEIYADDIRASHGSTIGQLDEDALFFLRARGIDESVARLLLTRAFAATIVSGVGTEAVREDVAARVESALSKLESATNANGEGKKGTSR